MKTIIETLKPKRRRDAGNVLPLHRTDEVRRTLHDMMNQLTVINLTCFKIRKLREDVAATPALSELQRLEHSADELMQLSHQLSEQFNQLPAPHRPQARLRARKALDNSTKVYRLFK
jgi:hypothetical protein